MVVFSHHYTHQNEVADVEIRVHLQLCHHVGDIHKRLRIHFGEIGWKFHQNTRYSIDFDTGPAERLHKVRLRREFLQVYYATYRAKKLTCTSRYFLLVSNIFETFYCCTHERYRLQNLMQNQYISMINSPINASSR